MFSSASIRPWSPLSDHHSLPFTFHEVAEVCIVALCYKVVYPEIPEGFPRMVGWSIHHVLTMAQVYVRRIAARNLTGPDLQSCHWSLQVSHLILRISLFSIFFNLQLVCFSFEAFEWPPGSLPKGPARNLWSRRHLPSVVSEIVSRLWYKRNWPNYRSSLAETEAHRTT